MASGTIVARVTGIEDFIKRTNDLKLGVRNKLQRRATTKASRHIRKLMKAKCPVSTEPHLTVKGLLKKSMGMKVKKLKRGGIAGIIGPRKGFRTQVGTTKAGKPIYQDPAKIAHLVEFGHGGPAPAPPHPFARPAWDEGASAAFQIYRADYEDGLAKLGRGNTVDDGGFFD